jgi:hypothetical protein
VDGVMLPLLPPEVHDQLFHLVDVGWEVIFLAPLCVKCKFLCQFTYSSLTQPAPKTLDHCYYNFGKADSILLLPAYRQKLKQEAPTFRSVQRWSDQSDSTLQDCFDHEDWDMFCIAANNNIDGYADSGSEFINKCIGNVVPTVSIKTFPNQKPWIDGSIRANWTKTRTNHCF